MSDLTVLHGVRTLQLTKSMNTIVDANDHASAAQHKWHANKGGTAGSRRFYAARRASSGTSVSLGTVHLHRVIANARPGDTVDHRNGDTLDNRQCNLRLCSHVENGQNRRVSSGASSKYKGVYSKRDRGNRWYASICASGKARHLGSFRTEVEAARAYDQAAIQEFGEFACTNAEIHGDY